MKTLDATTIVVRNRQRTASALDNEFIRSVNARLIHPIVIRRDGDDAILVVGGRRLSALIAGGTTTLKQGIHYRDFADLDELESRVIELEENVKREDLAWQDHVKAVGQLHETLSTNDPSWTKEKTQNRINVQRTALDVYLAVYRHLSSPLLKDATGIHQAYSILQIAAERKTAQIVGQITSVGNSIFGSTTNGAPSADNPSSDSSDVSTDPSSESENRPTPAVVVPSDSPDVGLRPNGDRPAVVNANFLQWITTYDGPKFNLIHCDFPYDIRYDSYAKSVTSLTDDYDFTGFWPLTDALVTNLDKIASYSAHIMFWFSMKFYEKTKTELEKGGLYVHDHPLVWYKSDNSGIIPGRDNAFPRRVYETAFLCSRGKRPLVKSLSNIYAAPMAGGRDAIHPSQKPEPMLNHFMSMLVDETTDMFDPTCGSGTSLRSAENCGARSVLGLELDASYAASAESATQYARRLRSIKL